MKVPVREWSDPEFDRHEPGFRKHDVKVKRNPRRGKVDRNPLSVHPDQQEKR
jgi:hypothetical protein